jgi:hypothetical protein
MKIRLKMQVIKILRESLGVINQDQNLDIGPFYIIYLGIDQPLLARTFLFRSMVSTSTLFVSYVTKLEALT